MRSVRIEICQRKKFQVLQPVRACSGTRRLKAVSSTRLGTSRRQKHILRRNLALMCVFALRLPRQRNSRGARNHPRLLATYHLYKASPVCYNESLWDYHSGSIGLSSKRGAITPSSKKYLLRGMVGRVVVIFPLISSHSL